MKHLLLFFFLLISLSFAERTKKTVALDIGSVFSSEPKWQERTQLVSTFELELTDYPVIPLRVVIHPLMYQWGSKRDYFASGAGVGSRFYLSWKKKEGLFFDIGSSLCMNVPQFPDNSSSFNFFTQMGMGYSSKVVVALRVQHYSNGNLEHNNLGWNAVVLSVGLRK